MIHTEIIILGRRIVGYELGQNLWYVDLHDISDWLYIDYEVSEVQQIVTPAYARYLIPVEELGRALLLHHIYSPSVMSQELLETLLVTSLSTLFTMSLVGNRIDFIAYLEGCYNQKPYEQT